jgi:hypothetical protein
LAMKNHPFSYWRSCRSPIVIMLLPGAEWELPISLWCAQLRASLRARGSARTPRAQGLCQMARFFSFRSHRFWREKLRYSGEKYFGYTRTCICICLCMYVYVYMYMYM